MRSRHLVLRRPPRCAFLGLLVVFSLALRVLAVCPPMCSCSRSHREVDCSRRGLRLLPDGLQHNVRSLNLSHNRFHSLDGRLTMYTHLRVLDVSHNRLSRVPAGLPRSLWQLHAAANRLQLLDKNATVYQWNLRTLDLSNNKLERAVFINNTLANLCALNLSHNHFWTLPTNMPAKLEVIDLSHNLLVKMLPGSLDRLPVLTRFYLHANRFSTLPLGVLDQMTSLRVITLGSNPWACHLYADISYLLSWTQRTSARVLGCPCHTQPVCGGVHPTRTAGWHFASYNLPPLAAGAQDLSSMAPGGLVTGWWSISGSAPNDPRRTLNAQHYPFTPTPRNTDTHLTIHQLSAAGNPGVTDHDSHHYPGTGEDSHTDQGAVAETPATPDATFATDRFLTTEGPVGRTRRTTTLRTRSVRRQNHSHPGVISNETPADPPRPSLLSPHILGLLLPTLRHVL